METAIFSPDRVYRYVLRRRIGLSDKTCLFIHLNPSTADECKDDPTIRRDIGFARLWGYGMLVVCNAFSLRSTDPKELYRHPDPVGPDNDWHLLTEASQADFLVVGWGVHGALHNRGAKVKAMLDKEAFPLHHLGLTKDGHPKHPLYLRKDTTPELWV